MQILNIHGLDAIDLRICNLRGLQWKSKLFEDLIEESRDAVA